jgi:myo-inositol 2-dehydrogenase/D-chiro-inositol 1-dehydrogenase
MSTIRIGWIGCGTHANEMLLPQLVRYPVEIVSLCDTDAARLAATAARYGVPPERRTGDWKSVIASGKIDAVGMAVGPAAHTEIGIAALESGLAVFMEKPPALNAAQARKLAAAAARSRKPCIVGFMKRYSTANRIAANVIRSADFGEPVSFLGESMTAPTYFARDADYSGFYLHHCVHYLDLVPHLMGAVEEMKVRRHELSPGKLLLHVDFRFRGGGLGTLVMGTHQSRGTPMEWWQVMADHRRVEVRNVNEVRFYRAPPFKVDRADASLVDGEDALIWEPNFTVAANEDHKGYHALIGDFLAAVRGEPNSAPTAEDGVRAMELLDILLAERQ